ncbi:MAG: polysaccharide lyase [Thermoleophilia bacterium]|nr:polysaccharide lyase [Thermoleophilia bacterium]MDH3725207.1 polysaccharide lyase [Thermoleophilia bacterium]
MPRTTTRLRAILAIGALGAAGLVAAGSDPLAGTAEPHQAEAASAAAKRAAKRATAIPGRLLRRGDYESGNLRQWGNVETVNRRRVRVVRSSIQGRFAGRFEVRDGESPLGFGERAEVLIRTGEREGQVRWYSWSTKFARNFPIARRGAWQVVTQWHSKANGSPPLGWFVEGNRLVLRAHRHSAPGRLLSVRDLWSGPIWRGKWNHIKMRVRWSGSDGRGWVELWMNGRKVLKRTKVRTMYPGIGNYFKQGYYRCGCLTKTGVVFHDGFRQSRG